MTNNVEMETEDLDGEWRIHERTLKQRDEVFRKQLERVNVIFTHKVPQRDRIALSAADVFVEKAQWRLTVRARLLWIAGGLILAPSALVLLLTVTFYLYSHLNPYESPWQPGLIPTNADYVLYGLRATAAAGFMASAIYFLISLSKACLDEAMILYNRRHALRFGRLYIYVKQGRIENIREFEDAFRWNETFSSSFRFLNPDKVPKGATGLLKLLTETVRNAKKEE